MKHHTKDKGDRGLGHVISTFLDNDIQVALPISEHLPFDCIAISNNGDLNKVSVKYRSTTNKGNITIKMSSSWADKKGNHTRAHKKTDYDSIAVYCPETKECYFMKSIEIKYKEITLRIKDTKNNQRKYIKLASSYKNPNRIFNR